jgi:hypothetical protein
MADYLQYWKYVYNAEALEAQDGLNHTAGDQLGKVSPGDTVWIVTIMAGRLCLVGRIVVGRVVSRRVAERVLRTTNLWDAKFHVIARRGTVSTLRAIDIRGIASRLQFMGSVDRLPRGYSGRSLQTLRTLTADSAKLLRRQWRHDGPLGEDRRFPRAATRAALEGGGTESARYVRGRSRRLRLEAIQRARGRCEACSRHYSRLLNGMGVRVLQVHHRRQLASSDAPRLTRIEDLAVLCANCHTLVHLDPGRAMPVADLKRRLRSSLRLGTRRWADGMPAGDFV